MVDKESYITNSSKQTQILGKKLSKGLKQGQILAFFGNLGSGKTTFIQGLAEGLGIKRRIISPTFIIIRHYKIKNGNFYHIDLYRTSSEKDLLGLGLDEIVSNKQNIVAVEWAEKMKTLLPEKRIEVYLKYINNDKREIKIKKYE